VILEVDPSGPVPPYEQIRSQIATMIETGVLSDGHRLPAIRQLAGDLGLAVNTVARAYRELESARLVVGRTRHGTTVASQPARLPRTEIKRRLSRAARTYIAHAQRLGVTANEAEAAIRAELGRAG
jgi:DNA-binding transcriptional regulator YhcF (GntR family)